MSDDVVRAVDRLERRVLAASGGVAAVNDTVQVADPAGAATRIRGSSAAACAHARRARCRLVDRCDLHAPGLRELRRGHWMSCPVP